MAAALANRRAAWIIDAGAVERLARRQDPRTDSPSGFERLAILHRLVGVCGGIADRRNAPGQEDSAERLAVALAQVGVDFDQAGNDRSRRRVDNAPGVQLGAMLADALDAISLDDDVDVGLRRPAFAVPQTARMDRRRRSRRSGRRPRQMRVDRADDAP